MRPSHAFLALSLLLLGWGSAAAAELLHAIRFAGNETTRPEVMLQEMSIQVGDPVDPLRIEESREAIMNLGLFKNVTAELLHEPEGAVLLITVEEKLYVLPIPRIGLNQTGQADYGMELRLDNLRGLNQRLKLVYLTKESTTSDTPLRREMSVDYQYPRVIGTPYQLGLSAGVVREDLVTKNGDVQTALYRHESHTYNVNLSRWLATAGPSRGWRYGGGIGLQQEQYDYQWGTTGLYSSSDNVNLNGFVEFYDVVEEKYRRKGRVYGYTADLGVPQLGDYSYNRQLFYYRRYIPLDAERSNLNYRFQLGLANGTAFGSAAYSLGSGTTLRGYESGYLTGNAMVLNNFEYLFPISGNRQMRGVVFVDAGNVYPEIKQADLFNLKVGAGLGLRWRVQLFVDVTLRLDVAWGLEPGTQITYVDTSTVF